MANKVKKSKRATQSHIDTIAGFLDKSLSKAQAKEAKKLFKLERTNAENLHDYIQWKRANN